MTTTARDKINNDHGVLTDLLNFLNSTNEQEDHETFLDELVLELAKLLGFEIASIFILDPEKNKLWSIASSDSKDIRIDSRLGISGEVVQKRKGIIINDAYDDPRFFAKVDKRTGVKTRDLVVVPLLNRNMEVLGTFQLINKIKGDTTKKDRELSETVATYIVNYLEANKKMSILTGSSYKRPEEKSVLKSMFSTKNIIGTSENIQNIIRIIEQVSDAPVNVLINGESGTGKELVAKAIHYSGNRSDKPFVALNCAAVPENLIESELFGIEKGVATGVTERTGKFQGANGGTIFLDEIGDLSPTSQAKILRVLQENAVQRVGSSKPLKIDVRIISATNKDLDQEIIRGNFREDLYYRLNVVQIKTPSLREISGDILILASHFLKKYCSLYKKDPKKLSNSARKLLEQYSWPGNIRELENLIKRLVVLVPSKIIREEHLPEYIRSEHYITTILHNAAHKSLKILIGELEQKVISETLEKHNNNRVKTAKVLGISRQALINKIKQYGIDR